MTLRNGESLHGWKLVASSCVRDLQGTDTFVTADDLPVCVLNSWNIRVSKCSFDKPQDQGALPYTSCPKHHYSIIITLFWHFNRLLGPRIGEKQKQKKTIYNLMHDIHIKKCEVKLHCKI